MSVLSNRKFKDEIPIKTISNLRGILNALDILPIEKLWHNSLKNYYSLTLHIEGTDITSNGKGTTQEFALASAYAELIERLQNFTHFRLAMNLNQDTIEYLDYYYEPDEVYMNYEDFISSDSEWIRDKISILTTENNLNLEESINLWKLVSYEDTPCDFIAIPFINIKSKKPSPIPIKMLSKMYMSNGMCAGNTPHEAVVQGLCEVLERHVNKALISKKITPPNIPQEYINHHPYIKSMIDQIESTGQYNIMLKDCSLGKGYPVIAAILINTSNNSYHVRLGAHPVFEIAAERTLTEMLQGQDIMEMKGSTRFSFKSHINNSYNNLMNILVSGTGSYPHELFYNTPSYSYTEMKDYNNLSNSELLNQLIDCIAKNGYNIYIRSTGFLGFPTYHIVVPGLSEIEEINNYTSIRNYTKYNQLKKYIRQLPKITNSQVEYIITSLSELDPCCASSIAQLLKLPINTKIPWYYTNTALLSVVLNVSLGRLEQASENLSLYIKNISKSSQINPSINNFLSYFYCMRDYIDALRSGLSKDDIFLLLSKFYNPSMLEGVMSEINQQQESLCLSSSFTCWDCYKCSIKNSCGYSKTENIYKRLKQNQKNAKLNQQSEIEKLFL